MLKLRKCATVVRQVRRGSVRLPVMTVNKVAVTSVPTIVRAKMDKVTLSNAMLRTSDPTSRVGEVVSLVRGRGWEVGV